MSEPVFQASAEQVFAILGQKEVELQLIRGALAQAQARIAQLESSKAKPPKK